MKTILVTGTNKGIGLEFARQYLNEGFKVIATCRNLSKLDGLNGLVNSFPDKISIYQMELLDEKSIEDFSLEIKDIPIDIFKLVEKINIEFLKKQFNSQSEVKITKYLLNLNSREFLRNNTKIKLTEKEINTILYLSKSKKPVSINELQENVWSYQSDIETHTVETHIYRLRKKIAKSFKDEEFIISKKNGYQIK